MSYPIDQNPPPLPSDPEYGEGESIDTEGWDKILGIAHWSRSHQSSASAAAVLESPAHLTDTTFQPVDEDGVGGDQGAALLVDPPRTIDTHEDLQGPWRQMVVQALLRADTTSGNSDSKVQAACELATFTGTGDGQESTTHLTPTITSRADDDWQWYMERFALKMEGSLRPVWGYPVARVDQDADEGDILAVTVRQIYPLNETTWAGSQILWWPKRVTRPLQADGTAVTQTAPGGRAVSLTSAGSSDPTLVHGALNSPSSASASWDPIHAVEFAAGEYLTGDYPDSFGDSFFDSIATRRSTTNAQVIWEYVDSGGSTVFKLEQDGSGNVSATVVSSGGTFTASAAHDGTGTWEDWTVWWDANDVLVLYKSGAEVARTSASGSISTSSSTHAVGAAADGSAGWEGDAAVPAFQPPKSGSSAMSRMDLFRWLAWREALTGQVDGPVVDVS